VNLIHLPDRATWLEHRRSGLGGSDVGAILGRAKYRDATPLRVWESKVSILDDEDNYTLARGRYMEAFIAGRLELECGGKVDRVTGFAIARSAADPCLIYSPDGFVTMPDGRVGVCEFKSRIRDAREWAEAIPDDVVTQAQHGMNVCDVDFALVACDVGNDLRWASVDRDPTWATEIRPRLIAWWHEYVVPQVPPPPQAEDAAVLARLYPRHSPGVTKAMPGEFIAVREEIEELETVRDAAIERINALKNRVRAEMGDAEIGVLATGAGWRWKTQHKQEHVVKASTSRPLTAFKAKER